MSVATDAGPEAPDPAGLEAEAGVFTRYLTGSPADARVVGAYVRVHGLRSELAGHGPADRATLFWARRGSWGARMADSYARVFAPAGLLRRKLVMLLAVLESVDPSYRVFERPTSTSAIAFWAGFGLRGAGFAFRTLLGIVLIGPAHGLATLASGRGAPEGPAA